MNGEQDDRPPTPSRGVPVTLDRERFFRYSFATRRKIIDALGKEALGKEAMTEGLAGDALIQVMWYGLLEDDPKLTTERLEELVDLENLGYVVERMSKALGYKGKATVTTGPSQPPPAAASDESR